MVAGRGVWVEEGRSKVGLGCIEAERGVVDAPRLDVDERRDECARATDVGMRWCKVYWDAQRIQRKILLICAVMRFSDNNNSMTVSLEASATVSSGLEESCRNTQPVKECGSLGLQSPPLCLTSAQVFPASLTLPWPDARPTSQLIRGYSNPTSHTMTTQATVRNDDDGKTWEMSQ